MKRNRVPGGLDGEDGLDRGRPEAGIILAVDLGEMLPQDPRRNEEIIDVEVHVVHDGTNGGIGKSGQDGGLEIESVAGKDLVAEEGDEGPLVEAGLNPTVAVKSGPPSIEAGRIRREIMKKTEVKQ